MNILFSSYFFSPSVGGLETVSSILAHEFLRQGHQVRLVTQTPDLSPSVTFPFEVIRQPAPLRLLGLVRWCDVYFQNHISLLMAWPLVLMRRPWVVTHPIWLSRDWKGRLKRILLRFATSISISRAIAADFPPSTVIPNPYDDDVFYERPDIPRERDLIFVGRLMSDKGAHLVLEALAYLRSQGLCLTLTIVGSGPEESNLRRLVQQLNLGDRVRFAGVLRGHDLARLLNAHRVMIVPSIWMEPFGVVALEGIACGCIVIGSEGGGLKDAIGPCGVTFPNGDVQALTRCLTDLFAYPEHWSDYRVGAAEHLARHTAQAISAAYLRVLEGAR